MNIFERKLDQLNPPYGLRRFVEKRHSDSLAFRRQPTPILTNNNNEQPITTKSCLSSSSPFNLIPMFRQQQQQQQSQQQQNLPHLASGLPINNATSGHPSQQQYNYQLNHELAACGNQHQQASHQPVNLTLNLGQCINPSTLNKPACSGIGSSALLAARLSVNSLGSHFSANGKACPFDHPLI